MYTILCIAARSAFHKPAASIFVHFGLHRPFIDNFIIAVPHRTSGREDGLLLVNTSDRNLVSCIDFVGVCYCGLHLCIGNGF